MSEIEEKPVKKPKVEEPKEDQIQTDPTAAFIETKPELARYSMAQVFREFLAKNYSRFNSLKEKKDYESAFKEFWGEK